MYFLSIMVVLKKGNRSQGNLYVSTQGEQFYNLHIPVTPEKCNCGPEVENRAMKTSFMYLFKATTEIVITIISKIRGKTH